MPRDQPPPIFRSLTHESEIELLVSLSAKVGPSAEWVARLLDSGETRLEWCRMALTDTGELIAAHAFDSWSPDGEPGAIPSFVHLFGHREPLAAAALLSHDLNSVAARNVQARVVIDGEAPPRLRRLKESQPSLLTDVGFELRVNRVRLRWSAHGTTPPKPQGALTFRSAASVAATTVERVFAEVGDGSLDHGMREDRAELGRRPEAARRLARARRRDHRPDWFAIGFNSAGDPVGYVQAARTESETPILAEIGVVESHRGHRYVDDLLAYATMNAIGAGAASLVSDTDHANHGMRAAFARAGYVEFATRQDFRWQLRADAS